MLIIWKVKLGHVVTTVSKLDQLGVVEILSLFQSVPRLQTTSGLVSAMPI